MNSRSTKPAAEQTRKLVTTDLLGKAVIPNLPFENADGSPIRLNTDYFGKKRDEANPFPGPFELPGGGKQCLKSGRLARATKRVTPVHERGGRRPKKVR